MIRLYGHHSGSFRQVTDGLTLAFQEHQALSGVYIPEEQGFDSIDPGGAAAPVAVVVGDPLRAKITHSLGLHREVWLMLAPNSQGIPTRMREELAGDIYSTIHQARVPLLTGFLSPSTWAKSVLEEAFPNHQHTLCPHGVFNWFKLDLEQRFAARQEFADGAFQCLHVASTNLSRKGTEPLLRAWQRFSAHVPHATLDVRANPRYSGDIQQLVKEFGCEGSVRVLLGQNSNAARWVQELGSYHLVVQPSRAEGFGLVPLEALALGVPVAITACTGHLQYLSDKALPAVSVIEHGPLEESDDYWGAQAPSVKCERILSALFSAYGNWSQLHDMAILRAAELSDGNSWANGAKEAVEKWKEKYERRE